MLIVQVLHQLCYQFLLPALCVQDKQVPPKFWLASNFYIRCYPVAVKKIKTGSKSFTKSKNKLSVQVQIVTIGRIGFKDGVFKRIDIEPKFEEPKV